MIHTVQISNTTALVYTVIAILTVVSAYVYGCSRTRRKSEQERNALQEMIVQHGQLIRDWQRRYEEAKKAWVDTFSKYTALQQEIECHIHEVHEEAEKPHVVTTEGYWDKESEFLNDVYKKPTDDTDQRIPGTGC